MAYFFTHHPLHRQPQFFSFAPCKYGSTLLPCNSHFNSQAFPFPCSKHALKPLHGSSSLGEKRLHETPKQASKYGTSRKNRPGFSSSSLDNKRVHKNLVETLGSVIINEEGVRSDGQTRKRLDYANRRKRESGYSSDRAHSLGSWHSEEGNGQNGKMEGRAVKGGQRNQEVKGKKWKRPNNKIKVKPTDTRFRVQLEMCSKAGDVMGAISLYDTATQRGIKMGQYHYTMVLYLCSSAALGVVYPAKSGSESRSIDILVPSNKESSFESEESFDTAADSESEMSEGESEEDEEEEDEGEDEEEEEEEDVYNELEMKEQIGKRRRAEILVSEPAKKYALEKGFEVYERMCSEKIHMNEAALTSTARMAMAMGDGDKAFDTVKQMKELGINPKLRSYGPALSVFCGKGDVEKAFEVEKHMLDHGVHPEEPELEALLRVCIEVGKSDKVYYLLHKLRTTVRSVKPSTADLIQKWFESKEASRIGKRKWDPKMIVQTMESGGGGWHGQGWLGGGKWSVSRTVVEEDGSCKCCGEKLALIDLDPEETEKFAESVASIALKREKNSGFQKFQRWLNYYGPFEAIVDAANVGLYSQKKFQLSKVKAVVNGIRQMLTSKKWPLVVLHNRRITGPRMDEPINRAIIERWKTADALYSTPTGSNDDWFWLYAAIKYRCLLVTNDEMRDHIFQLLGNDFFPRWKERHQVRFSFSEVGPVFHMPPPCSVVIQESERGHWHIPIVADHQSEEETTWLCITRMKTSDHATKQDPLESINGEMEDERRRVGKQAQESSGRNATIIPKSAVQSHQSIVEDIQSAEGQSGYVIDFQI